MAHEDRTDAQAARAAAVEAILGLLTSGSEDVLRSLIDNPAFDEMHVCSLLERKDLSGLLLEEISKRMTWRANYRVRLGLAVHPHTPRRIAMRLMHELHLMDLTRISLLPTSSMELRRLAEESVLAQLPHLPLGQKLMLARRGSARIAARLLSHGPEQVARVALDNSFLTESQLLNTLAKQSLPARMVAVVARHAKWSKLVNIRVALLRHSDVPPERVPKLVPGLPRRAIEDLLGLSRLPPSVRAQLRRELAHKKGFEEHELP
jgi:pimeloyl-ACP methyl ester carboxylesterase